MTADTPKLDARQFHNALRILGSIDRHEMVKAGALSDSDIIGWTSFESDPECWAIRADDDQYAALFSIIESRIKP